MNAPILVGTGFSDSSTEAKWKEEHEESLRVGNEWMRWDQTNLVGSSVGIFDDGLSQAHKAIARKWRAATRAEGRKRKSLEFLLPEVSWFDETLEEAQAEDPNEEELQELLDQLIEESNSSL
ncbi:uncharacterized protein JCM6883_002460 [Sporobolomyces salmoneus]|uniref:uncharacterized protein n=1 Tax=Sporobolomyces salmoneus TaxID=183962 RepID=UPI0031795C45